MPQKADKSRVSYAMTRRITLFDYKFRKVRNDNEKFHNNLGALKFGFININDLNYTCSNRQTKQRLHNVGG